MYTLFHLVLKLLVYKQQSLQAIQCINGDQQLSIYF